MADKIASGSWHEAPPGGPARERARDPKQQAEADRLRARRDNARWSAVVGFGLLFAASFSTTFAIGGAAMIVYGAAASMYWSWRLGKVLGDPWAYDPDLDGPHAPEWSRTGRPPKREDVEDDVEPPLR